jgi:hypothetical protein
VWFMICELGPCHVAIHERNVYATELRTVYTSQGEIRIKDKVRICLDLAFSHR